MADDVSQPTGQPPGAVVQHLLVRYAKRGRMRFASHRDVGRAMERAVRQAGLPVAYSAGYTPHPKISYAVGAPTGAASEAEYLTMALAGHLDPARVAERLNAALPVGLDVVEVAAHQGGTLVGRLTGSQWHLTLPGVPDDVAATAVADFLGTDRVEVDRPGRTGSRRVDARAAVLAMQVDRHDGVAGPGDGVTTGSAIRMVLRHTEPAVRPDDVLTALRLTAGGAAACLQPTGPTVVTRLAQFASPTQWDTVQQAEGKRLVPVTADGPTNRDRENLSPAAAVPAGSAQVDSNNEFPRGARDPQGVRAPGSLTGDCPDARNRAERQRVRQ